MDEFVDAGDGDYVEEEMLEEGDEFEVAEVEQSEAQRSEAADISKLLRHHNEVFIPYEEQVFAQLHTTAPGVSEANVSKIGFRDTTKLDSKHVTYPFLTNYERTKIISFRASQISNGTKPYILVPDGVTDSYQIAKLELEAKRLPYIVKRPLPDGTFEAWQLADLLLF
jgi:DNA-directed RNA polymerase I, II, and III subunit RPABC2